MSDEVVDNEERRAELLEELNRLNHEIRRRLLALVEHPDISDDFKNNAVVKEWVK
jgi:hypothetical protein